MDSRQQSVHTSGDAHARECCDWAGGVIVADEHRDVGAYADVADEDDGIGENDGLTDHKIGVEVEQLLEMRERDSLAEQPQENAPQGSSRRWESPRSGGLRRNWPDCTHI